jgi:dolichyl-phosphate beta-glucosyltransferase
MQKTCIVIPCFNEELRLNVIQLKKDISQYEYYILFVNDGSSDNTINILFELQKTDNQKIEIFDLKNNNGKAEAIRKGMLKAKEWQSFDIIGFLDADLATPISEVQNIVKFISDPIVFAFGSRVKIIGAKILRKPYRHIIGRIFATMAGVLLNIDAYDTQCGAKFFSSHQISNIFEKEFTTNWIFDLEIFLRFKSLFPNTSTNIYAKEVPLGIWEDINGSKIKFKDYFKILFDLIKLLHHSQRKT